MADWSSRYGLLVLAGCEVTTEEGHLLVFGLDRYIFGMHHASFVKELVDRSGGVLVVTHPYRARYHGEAEDDKDRYRTAVEKACRDHVFSLADAVEASNGRGSEAENRFSLAIQERLGTHGTGASDAHRLDDVGTFATEFDKPIHGLDDLIGELRSGRYHPSTLRAPWATASRV
jgi:predicted metal-dependent phosphoesterase TrpH